MTLANPDTELDVNLDIAPQCEWYDPPFDEAARCQEEATHRVVWDTSCHHLTNTHLICDDHINFIQIGFHYHCPTCTGIARVRSIHCI